MNRAPVLVYFSEIFWWLGLCIYLKYVKVLVGRKRQILFRGVVFIISKHEWGGRLALAVTVIGFMALVLFAANVGRSDVTKGALDLDVGSVESSEDIQARLDAAGTDAGETLPLRVNAQFPAQTELESGTVYTIASIDWTADWSGTPVLPSS